MSQSHAKRGTDSPQTKHKKRRVNKQNSLTQYGLTGSGMRLLESHGIFTDLYQAIVRMHQTLIFFFLNYPFTAWGVAASRAQHLAKSFTPSSIPTIPARMKTHITADSKKTDTAARRPTPPPEDIIADTEGDRHLRLREDRHRHQKTSSTTPRRSTPPNPRRTKTPEEQSPLSSECREYFVSNITPPPTPPPSKQKQKQKQIQSNFFHKQTPTKELLFFFNSFSIFFNSFSKQRSDHWATQVPLHPIPQKHIVPQYPI